MAHQFKNGISSDPSHANPDNYLESHVGPARIELDLFTLWGWKVSSSH
jgi:hypothetical protein